MTATLVLPGTAPGAEWLEARRRGITASEIAVLMGLSPYSSPYALYHQKTGDLPGEEENDAMRLGSYMEDFVAEQFTRRRPEFCVHGNGRTLYAHPDRPWQMATPDRLVDEVWFEPDNSPALIREERRLLATLECKIDGGSDGWGEDGSDEIPVHYRCQVLWQMDVMDVTTGYVACLLWHRRQVRVYELTMDDDALRDLALMRMGAERFRRYVAESEPPPVDWRPATTDALKRLHPSVEDVDVPVRRMPVIQYQAACKAFKAAEQRKKLAENRLRELLGTGHRVTDRLTGEVIARRDVYDLAEKTITRKACTVDRLIPVKPEEQQ